MITPTTPGKHVIDGVEFRVNNIGAVTWRSDCSQCTRQMVSQFGTMHTASQFCESGKRDHCSCDRCW